MAVRVVCGSCRGPAEFPDAAAGMHAACPRCGAVLVVPAAVQAFPGALPSTGAAPTGAAAWGSAAGVPSPASGPSLGPAPIPPLGAAPGPSLGTPRPTEDASFGLDPFTPTLGVGLPSPSLQPQPRPSARPSTASEARSPLPILLGVGGGVAAIVVVGIVLFSGSPKPTRAPKSTGEPRVIADARGSGGSKANSSLNGSDRAPLPTALHTSGETPAAGETSAAGGMSAAGEAPAPGESPTRSEVPTAAPSSPEEPRGDDAPGVIRRFDPSRPPPQPPKFPHPTGPGMRPPPYEPQTYYAAYMAEGKFPQAAIPPTQPTPRPPSLAEGADRTFAHPPQQPTNEGSAPVADPSFMRPKRAPRTAGETKAKKPAPKRETKSAEQAPVPPLKVGREGLTRYPEEKKPLWKYLADPAPGMGPDDPPIKASTETATFGEVGDEQPVYGGSAARPLVASVYSVRGDVLQKSLTIYDVLKGEKIGGFPLKSCLFSRMAIDAEANVLIHQLDDVAMTLAVVSLADGKERGRLEGLGRNGKADRIDVLGQGRVFAHDEDASLIWTIGTPKPRLIEWKQYIQVVPTPGGRHLFGIQDRKFSIRDSSSGKESASGVLPVEVGGVPYFSPDGAEFVIEASGERAFYLFDFVEGRLRACYRPPSETRLWRMEEVQWLGDRRGWCFGGEMVVERETGQVVEFDPMYKRGLDDTWENVVLASSRLLAPSDKKPRRYVLGPLPIDASRKATVAETAEQAAAREKEVADAVAAARKEQEEREALAAAEAEAAENARVVAAGPRPLRDVDWGGVLSIPEQLPPGWAVRPDPSPDASSDDLYRLPLLGDPKKLQGLFFSRFRQDVAVQSSEKSLSYSASDAQCWVDLYDLRSKKHLQRTELPPGTWIDSRSPEGGWFLTFDDDARQRIDLWKGSDFRHVVGVKPFVEEAHPVGFKDGPNSILWTGFADEERLWTWNGKRQLVCFQVPTMKALYVYTAPVHSAPAFSPGRAAIGFLTPTGLRWLDAKTGTNLGEAPCGEEAIEPGGTFCISPDGAYALMGRRERCHFVDLSTGESDGGVQAPGGYAGEYHWIRGSYVLQGGRGLYSIPSRAVVWGYSPPTAGNDAKHHDAPRDGRHWVAGEFAGKALLVAAPLPHPEGAGAAAALSVRPPVLRRGSKVRVEWACEALPDFAKFRAEMENKLGQAGFETSDDAPLAFRFELTPPTPTLMEYMNYETLQPMQVTVTNSEFIASLIDAADRSVYWRKDVVCGGYGGSLTREQAANPSTIYLKEAQAAADRLVLPLEVYPQPKLGSYRIDGMGLTGLDDALDAMYAPR